MAKRDKGMLGAPLGEFTEPVAPAKNNKPAPQKGGKKEKGPNIFKRIGHFFKEMWSELKKVTWPTVPKVAKQTGIVLVVVLVFLLILLGVDSLMSFLLQLLTDVQRF